MAESGRVTDIAVYQGLADFRYALRRFLAFSESVLKHAGITSRQYQALLVIGASSDAGTTIKDIAEQLLLQPHGAVQLVDRLVASGLAERTQSSLDRRSVIVRLTPNGHGKLETLSDDHVAELLKHQSLLVESLARLRKISPFA